MGAPLNPVPNVLKVVLTGWIDNTRLEIWENILHFSFSGGPPSGTDCVQIASSVGAAWQTNMAPACPSPTVLDHVTVTDLTSDTAHEGVASILAPGTRGDDSIPANAALLISYPSVVRYKGGHPRSYLYVLGNADLTGAMKWTSPATQEVRNDWVDFLIACGALHQGTTQLTGFVTVRYKGKYLPNGGPPHFYLDNPLVNPVVMAGVIGHEQIASQRRRIGRERS